MNRDAQIRRAAILKLGRGILKRNGFLESLGVDPLDYFLDEMEELKRRKLIIVNKNEIRISYIGQFYWTYVCAHLFSKEILWKIYNIAKKEKASINI